MPEVEVEEAGQEVHALAVLDLRVVEGVGFEDVFQGGPGDVLVVDEAALDVDGDYFGDFGDDLRVLVDFASEGLVVDEDSVLEDEKRSLTMFRKYCQSWSRFVLRLAGR